MTNNFKIQQSIASGRERDTAFTGKIVNGEHGMSLVIVIMIMALLLSVIGGGLLFSGINLKTASHLRTGTQAFYIADAGITHAGEELANGNGTNDFAAIFAAANGTQVASNTSFGGGTYVVTRAGSATSPDRVKLVSVGTASNGAIAQLEAWFKQQPTPAPKAIQTDGELKINGNPKIMGLCGGAHSNDDVQISGNPGIQMVDGVTASNSVTIGGQLAEGMDISGNPCIGSPACGDASPPSQYVLDTNTEKNNYEAGHNNAAEQTLPTINPAAYAPKVAAMEAAGNHYILHDNGTVTLGGSCGSNGLCTGGTAVSVPAGWTFSSGTWIVGGSSAANGVFYSEGKIEVGGSPGTSESPWQATLISRDSMIISGNPYIKPYPTSSTDLQNQLLVSGNDLTISGSNGMMANYEPGAILVHQQIKISGNPQIKGFIMSGDGQPTWTGDPFPNSSDGVTLNEISGNPIMNYSCEFSCVGPGCPAAKIVMAGWAQK
jgi:hypothetical protein